MSALLWWCDFTYTICSVTLPTERVSWNIINHHIRVYTYRSRSPRSVWVEILCRNVHCIGFESRSPRSVWVEIDTIVTLYCFAPCHAPHGACELKFSFSDMQKFKIESRSPRSVWVEIYTVQYPYFVCYGHAPHGACELKYNSKANTLSWKSVTLPTERVSWNPKAIKEGYLSPVTLPTERVSWNLMLI